MNTGAGRLFEVLLVEDNPGDVLLTRKAFERAEMPNHLVVVSDGEAAIEYLERCLEGDEIVPDLVLLDINLPKVTGHEVLRHVKSRPRLRRIPIVMLSGSDADRDVIASYENHANSFITKPPSLNELVATVAELERYWHSLVRTPPMDE